MLKYRGAPRRNLRLRGWIPLISLALATVGPLSAASAQTHSGDAATSPSGTITGQELEKAGRGGHAFGDLPIAVGIEAYGGLATRYNVDSSSGFYHGQANDTGAWGLDASISYKFGPIPGIDHWRWGIGTTLGFIRSSETFTGLGGGNPATGHGAMTEYDALLGPRILTTIDHRTIAGFFVRGGVGILSPEVAPLGPFGPSTTGTAVAPVVRAGFEVEHVLGSEFPFGSGFKMGGLAFVQYTAPVAFRTTLANEDFRFPGETRFMLGLTFRYDNTPRSGEIRSLAPR